MLAILNRPIYRSLLFLVVLLVELIVITVNFEVPVTNAPDSGKMDNLAGWLFIFTRVYWQVAVWVICACLFVLAPHYKTILNEFVICLQGYRWLAWLMIHLLIFAAFLTVTSIIFEQPPDPAYLTIPWFSIWISMAGATLALWLLALAPYNFWQGLMHDNRTRLLFGVLLGVCVWTIIEMFAHQEAPLAQKDLWLFFGGITLQIVYWLLSWFYNDLIYQPDSLIVGTASFPVEISHLCSGIEGILLITLFLAIYMWLFRRDLRFPQSLWLFPLGILAIWLANAVRIALLIAVGSSFSREVAEKGFHTHAGWIAFTLIAMGAIILSHRMRFFSVHQRGLVNSSNEATLATALLAPLLVQIAALMVTSAFSSGFDWLYPIRIGMVIAVLCYYRNFYTSLVRAWSWHAPMIGGLVFIAWMLLESNSQSNGITLNQGLENLPDGLAAIWLVFRVFGSVIAVPLAEELAFRGYIIRKLIAKDYENVPNGTYNLQSFIVSSLLFGLLHDRWFAGTLAGMGYAIALYRRGNLGDAVVAHMTTNGLIAAAVLLNQRWDLWA